MQTWKLVKHAAFDNQTRALHLQRANSHWFKPWATFRNSIKPMEPFTAVWFVHAAAAQDVSENSEVTLGIPSAPRCRLESALLSVSRGAQRKKKRAVSLTPPVKRQTVNILTQTNTSLRSHGIRLTLPAQNRTLALQQAKKIASEIHRVNNLTQTCTCSLCKERLHKTESASCSWAKHLVMMLRLLL